MKETVIKHLFSLIFIALISWQPSFAQQPLAYSQLDWPVELKRWPTQFGPNFGQYQDLGSRYFHAGQDILSFAGEQVKTPVAGRVSGGFYSYNDLPNGHSEKNLVTLGEHYRFGVEPPWGFNYFEISVTTEDGYRFEFHHIDSKNLKFDLQQKILKGGWVEAGETIGRVVDFDKQAFGVKYDHIHYNVYGPEGRALNPMAVSKFLNDDIPPIISLIGFGGKDQCKRHRGEFYKMLGPSVDYVPSDSGFLVIHALDRLSGNSIYQAPTLTEVHFQGHSKVIYDFRRDLFNNTETPLDIRNIFQEEMCTGIPDMALPIRGSTFKDFYLKVKIPEDFEGTAEITISDFSGNQAKEKILILKKSMPNLKN